MSYVAAAIVTAAYVGYQGTKNAAASQSDSANAANGIQQSEFQQQQQNQAPWVAAGTDALGQIKQQMPDLSRPFTMADFQADPGYDFRMSEGQKAIERSAAARGGLSSGATMKALDRFSQDTASNEFNNVYNRFTTNQNTKFNRLASVAQIGQNANTQLNAAGENMANNLNNNVMSQGNAAAAGQIGGANAITSGLNTGVNSWMNMQMMNRMFPTVTQPNNGIMTNTISGQLPAQNWDAEALS